MTNVASENSKSRNAQGAEAGAPMSTQLPKVSSSPGTDLETAKCKGIEGADIVIEPTDIILPAPKRTIRLRLEAMDDQGVVDAYKGGKTLTAVALAELRARFGENKKLNAPGFEACKVWDDCLKVLGIAASTARRRIAASGVENPASKHTPRTRPQPKVPKPSLLDIANAAEVKGVSIAEQALYGDTKPAVPEVQQPAVAPPPDEAISERILREAREKKEREDKEEQDQIRNNPIVDPDETLRVTFYVLRTPSGDYVGTRGKSLGRGSRLSGGIETATVFTLRGAQKHIETAKWIKLEIVRVHAFYTLTPVTPEPEPSIDPEPSTPEPPKKKRRNGFDGINAKRKAYRKEMKQALDSGEFVQFRNKKGELCYGTPEQAANQEEGEG